MWKTGLSLAKSISIVLLLVALVVFVAELEGVWGQFSIFMSYTGEKVFHVYGLWSGLLFGSAIVLIPLVICLSFSRVIMPSLAQKISVMSVLGLLAVLLVLSQWQMVKNSDLLMTDFTLSPSKLFREEVDAARKQRFAELKSKGTSLFCDNVLMAFEQIEPQDAPPHESISSQDIGKVTVRGLIIPGEYKLTEFLEEAEQSDQCQAHYKKAAETLFTSGRHVSAQTYYHLTLLLTPNASPDYAEISAMYDTLKLLTSSQVQ